MDGEAPPPLAGPVPRTPATHARLEAGLDDQRRRLAVTRTPIGGIPESPEDWDLFARTERIAGTLRRERRAKAVELRKGVPMVKSVAHSLTFALAEKAVRAEVIKKMRQTDMFPSRNIVELTRYCPRHWRMHLEGLRGPEASGAPTDTAKLIKEHRVAILPSVAWRTATGVPVFEPMGLMREDSRDGHTLPLAELNPLSKSQPFPLRATRAAEPHAELSKPSRGGAGRRGAAGGGGRSRRTSRSGSVNSIDALLRPFGSDEGGGALTRKYKSRESLAALAALQDFTETAREYSSTYSYERSGSGLDGESDGWGEEDEEQEAIEPVDAVNGKVIVVPFSSMALRNTLPVTNAEKNQYVSDWAAKVSSANSAVDPSQLQFGEESILVQGDSLAPPTPSGVSRERFSSTFSFNSDTFDLLGKP